MNNPPRPTMTQTPQPLDAPAQPPVQPPTPPAHPTYAAVLDVPPARTYAEAMERRVLFAEALTSGRYTKTVGTLCYRRPTGATCFCVQGVACDLLFGGRWILDDVLPRGHGYLIVAAPWLREGGAHPNSASEWPEPVRWYYGLSHDDARALVTLNDSRQEPFDVIARALLRMRVSLESAAGVNRTLAHMRAAALGSNVHAGMSL